MTQSPAKKILLADDDPIAIAVAQRAFRSAPHGTRLQVVTDGMEALRYVSGAGRYADRETYPMPNVILLDIHMTRLGGLEFLHWLREQAPVEAQSMPVVIVSASGVADDLNRARALGVDLILLKPVRWSTFWRQLTNAGVLG